MRLLLLLISLFFFKIINAQIDFEYLSYEEDENRQIFIGHEDPEGNHIIPITISKPEETFIQFIKIDDNGNVLLSSTFKYDSSFLLINQFFFIENEIIVFGTVGNEPLQPDQAIWVGKFDLNFTFLNEQFFDPLGEHRAILLEAFLENDSTIIFGGITSDTSIGLTDFGGKLFLPSNTIYVNYLDSLNTTLINDVIARRDSSGYILYGSGALRFTDSLFQLTRDELTTEIQFLLQGAILSQNDSTLLLSGNVVSTTITDLLKGMIVGAFDYDINLKKYHRIFSSSEDTIIKPATKQSIEINEEGFIYAGSTYNVDNLNPFESSNNSAFLLVKYDADLNPLWQKYYGLDSHYYYMSGLIATSDGGCLMYGHRFTEDERWEAVAIKVSENGVMTNTNVLMNEERIEIYPNPFRSVININNKEDKIKEIKILDGNGRILLSRSLTKNQESIDLSFLANGIYFYVIENQETILQKGKLMKME